MKIKVFKNQLNAMRDMMVYFVFQGVRTDVIDTMPVLCSAVKFYTELKTKSERYTEGSGKIAVNMEDGFVPVFYQMLTNGSTFSFIKEHPELSMETITEITSIYEQLIGGEKRSVPEIEPQADDVQDSVNPAEDADSPDEVTSADENAEADMADIEAIKENVEEREVSEANDEDDIKQAIAGVMNEPEVQADELGFATMGYAAEDDPESEQSEFEPDFNFDDIGF